MLQSNTLKGLDDALVELQHAIENLPEGSKRKQLLERFQRIQRVRENIDHPELLEEKRCPWYVPVAGAVLALLVIYLLLRKLFK